MASPMTEFRRAVKAIVDAEFAGEVTVREDKLHESVGKDGHAAGIWPDTQVPGDQGVEQRLLVFIQLYRRYDLQVDPEQRVDPAAIEEWVDRLQHAVARGPDPNTGSLWYFNVAAIEYPDDPTGNKSRAVIAVEGYGDSPTMVETTA